jgi:chitinase
MFIKYIKVVLLLIFSVQICSFGQKKEIVAYYPSWGAPQQKYLVKNVKTSGSADKITVLIYSFITPTPDSTKHILVNMMNPYIDYQQPYSADMSVDGVPDDSTQPLKGQFNQLKKLKAEHPGLKILLCIGGWGGGNYFSDAALTAESRKIFVNDCINKFIYGNIINNKIGTAANIFDGFDIDWEFPVSGGPDGTHYNINDKENLTKLLAVFREKMDEINPRLILTNAVPAAKPNLDNFDIRNDQKYLNWFNLMTYDFHGIWDKTTAHHTNLFSSSYDTTDYGTKLSFDKTVRYFLDSLRIDPGKLVPGAAFYGKCWFNVGPADNGLFQPGKDSAAAAENNLGNFSNFYNLQSEGYKYYWDAIAMAPWLYNKDKKIFWTLDDPKSIALKSRYVEAYNLRGIMFWEISEDDSIGTLVHTIYNRNMPDVKINKAIHEKNSSIIQITQPKNKSTFASGSNVIINTSEIGKRSSIIKVEFFGDGHSLGYTTIAPFDWVWFNVHKGRHKINVVATDEYGNKKSSKEVTISIY